MVSSGVPHLKDNLDGIPDGFNMTSWISSTIQSTAQLEIVHSKIPGVRLGVIAREEIQAGEEVFRAKKRPFYAVEIARRADCCDNCLRFAKSLLHDSGRFVTDLSMKFTVSKCCGCSLLSYCSKVQLNSMFMAGLEHPERIGLGLDVFSSLMNQSCAPNAHYFFEGLELRVRPLRSIRPGEKIEISYMNNTYNYVFRQRGLKSIYFFICECIKCKEDASQRHEPGIIGLGSEQLLQETQSELLYSMDVRTAEDVERSASLVCSNAFPDEASPVWLRPMPDVSFIVSQRQEQDQILGKAL